VYYFDVELRENGHFSLDIPKTWNSIIFVFQGEVIYNDATRIPHEHVAVLDK
jgi:redox-sensitive bicupin YhaK (pirin superfamily)